LKKSNSNIPLKTYYGTDSQPGEYPFTNGIYPDMYKGKLWTMRQYAGFTSAEESNKRYRYLLDQGVMGLSVAFDLPTQTGYDSDHSMAYGEVGRVGVPICTIADMEVLMKDIPLGEVSISMTINSTAAILLAFLVAAAENQGINRNQLRGTVQNDNRIAAVELMVMEIETSPKGISFIRTSISAIVQMGTPTLPTSP
jgi:methylmalonyl-CoA mutase N-terminal domain/subunit